MGVFTSRRREIAAQATQLIVKGQAFPFGEAFKKYWLVTAGSISTHVGEMWWLFTFVVSQSLFRPMGMFIFHTLCLVVMFSHSA
jgi:hypothetical protein